MSDDDSDPMEEMLKVHRKEKKDIQAKVQALKKTASKGDKKKKKEVADEIAKLEKDLQEKHKTDLSSFSSADTVNELSTINVEKVDSDTKDDEGEMIGELKYDIKDNGVSKSQKRRDKKSAKEKNRLKEIEAQEVDNLQGVRHLEQERIKEVLDARGLCINEIPSDGDCMFAGVLDQLQKLQISSSVHDLRRDTSEHILIHKDKFAPFLSNPTTGDMLSETEFTTYCQNMAETPAWGGQIELKAMATFLKRPIEVIQAEGPPMIVGEEFSENNPILLTYHRHAYGLGEHYNSVTTK